MKRTFRGNAAERGIQIYAAVAALVIFSSGLVYLSLGHLPVTHRDFWDIYDVCLNRPWFDSAFLKYNGHSHFSPSQLWLADLRFFHGNTELLFIVGLASLLITTGLMITPTWRDPVIGGTGKLLATVAIVTGNFWMGRAQVTASGGFNCCYPLPWEARSRLSWPYGRCLTPRARWWIALIIMCAILSSFSFRHRSGYLAKTLFLAYCLRASPPRSDFARSRWYCSRLPVYVVTFAGG
jgi:hypothetical protein